MPLKIPLPPHFILSHKMPQGPSGADTVLPVVSVCSAAEGEGEEEEEEEEEEEGKEDVGGCGGDNERSDVLTLS